MCDLFWLSDEAWAVLEPPLLKNRSGGLASMTGTSSAASCMT
jgi:hypothetical protein